MDIAQNSTNVANYPPWLEKILKFRCLKWPERHKMVHHGLENIFEFSISEMDRNAFKLSTMVGENFEIFIPEMAKNAFKLFTKFIKKIKIIYLNWLIFHLFHTYSNNYKASSLWTIMETRMHVLTFVACHIICM